MIILYALFAVFVLITMIIPFYLMWCSVGIFSPTRRQQVKAANRCLTILALLLFRLVFRIIIAFVIAILWIDVLKFLLVPVEDWNGPLSFLPLIKGWVLK